ncbi:response regulator [bacterium]|nr:response regulator [bacterium]
MKENHLLIIEDDPTFGMLLEEKFKSLKWVVMRILAVEDVYKISQIFTHCILDLNLSHQSGLTVIPSLLKQSPNCKIVVLTGYASVQTTIEAIKLGAVYLLSKPSSITEIINAFEHLANPEKVRMDNYSKNGIDLLEWETIQKALISNQFNISKTAEELGLHRRTLQRKLKKKM